MALNIALRKFVSRSPAILECKPYILPSSSYSTDTEDYRVIEKPHLSSTVRGTGYRSSFNGTVCTVFGCTGFVGAYLVPRLGRTGTQIIAAYRGSHDDVLPLRVASDLGQMLFSKIHLRDEASIRKAVKYSNVVVNLIGQDCDSWNFKLEEVHIDAARRIARICRESGVKKLIHVSSMGVTPTPKTILVPGGSHFLKTKWAGEQAVREEFPDAIIVRPADIFGEEDRFFQYYGEERRLVDRKLFLHEGGENTIKQPVYIENVSDGLYELVMRPSREVAGKTYQFVGPERYNLGELCDYLYEIMWKDKDFGYERLDSRLSIEFNVMLRLRNFFYVTTPDSGITIERFERENTTDDLDKNLPTLTDLGVDLHKIDRYSVGFLRSHRVMGDYVDDVLERILPDLPTPVDK